jgi:hypothetical protein
METAMIIASSDITMTSSHVKLQTQTTSESLSMWAGTERPGRRHHYGHDRVELSRDAKMAERDPEKCHGKGSEGESCNIEPGLQMFKSIIEKLSGSKINTIATARDRYDVEGKGADCAISCDNQPEQKSAGFGVSYEFHDSYKETEATSFSAAGVVTTADGRKIDLSLDLSMQRSFASETNLSIQMGDAVKKDPLVINLNGSPAQLGDTRMSFDIDADGTADQIATLAAGSGFLALDNNGDGIVNDGSELFGTQSGNGFADLAAYDLDGNNWIDENDAVFNDLSVWQNPGDNGGTLLSLKESGIGAIYLGNVSTPFDLKDASNSDLGQVKASGIYLAEAGGVGTIQQLDLAV